MQLSLICTLVHPRRRPPCACGTRPCQRVPLGAQTEATLTGYYWRWHLSY
ncbi:hypothetical protein BAE44_0002437 [Dichanthelium oligosanthes]|uniref:Uncharacterized protein n=1 Tax=Dichanthelium oligosanthes TaxID=888268 RepID=A0A1E5WGS1_9POAL|nr:hypothetical protein BAE44_0002437 [Dichanthelium oligosanthes]